MRALELARRLGLLAGDKTGTRARGCLSTPGFHRRFPYFFRTCRIADTKKRPKPLI